MPASDAGAAAVLTISGLVVEGARRHARA